MDLRGLKDFKWINMGTLTEVWECKETKKKNTGLRNRKKV